MTQWHDLDGDTQLKLRLDYQAHLDRQPKTCSLDDKIAAFARWLAARDVAFSADDLRRPAR